MMRLPLRAGIRRYLRIIGITRGEVHAIRKNLLQPRHTDDNGDALSADMLSTFSMGSDPGGADVSPLSDAEQSPNTRHRRRHRRKGLAAQLE
jgi:hypothetical protein